MFGKKDKQKLVAAGLPERFTSEYLMSIQGTRQYRALISLFGTAPVTARISGTDKQSK